MKLIAVPTPQKPFIVWQSWAGEESPLVINEADMPAYQFGVCPWKIEAGELIGRTPEEMAVFEAEYVTLQTTRNYARKVDALDNEFFVWNGFNFPMFETARLFYSCIQYSPGNNYKVLDTAGVQQTVTDAETAAFIAAFYSKLTTLTQP